MRNPDNPVGIRRYPETTVVVKEKVVRGPDPGHHRITVWTFCIGACKPCPGLALGPSRGSSANGLADSADIAVTIRQPDRTVRRFSDRGRVTGKRARRFKS